MDKPTEEQIRAHIRVLIAALHLPCRCKTRQQKRECAMNRHSLGTVVGALQWILGENPSYEELVANLASSVPNPFLPNRIVRFEKEEPKDG